MIESGYTCTGGSSTQGDTCTEICGDSYHLGKRQCDDFNSVKHDGCDACTQETGWTCTWSSFTSTYTCTQICADGYIVHSLLGSTYCDDGNTIAGDGCTASCIIENGYSCTGGTY